MEKLTSEYVIGRQDDIWDAHMSEGRWWMITKPTNLDSQEAIKSMDVALSFHIGFMSRVMARAPERQAQSRDRWMLEVLRRLDTATASLNRAREAEGCEAVGMRLHEALITLAARLAFLELAAINPVDPPKRGDVKAWAAIGAPRRMIIAGGPTRSATAG